VTSWPFVSGCFRGFDRCDRHVILARPARRGRHAGISANAADIVAHGD
jgi:hypothetical protein